MLKPSGRAAIVLPQGKFNNSSLAFIREWILKKARLLAVVGLHPNTFKPHTGTKTSVLFVQKYTPEQLDQIAKVHDDVASACPDYEVEIKDLLEAYKTAADVPDDTIPEMVTDLIAESFSEPEDEEVTNGDGVEEYGDKEASTTEEDRVGLAEEKLNNLKSALLKAKQKMMDLESDFEAMEQQHTREIAVITQHWAGPKGDLRTRLKTVKEGHKATTKALKETQKDKHKVFKARIKALEKQIPLAERDLMVLSNRGKLELMLADEELIDRLKERWIAAEVAKKLDYPIFMAVSEQGGKNNSGDYDYVIDEDNSLVEFPDGHPQEGQLVVKQDLVNYDLTANDLANATKISDGKLCITEAFVRFAQEQKFSFWGGE